MTDRCPFDVAGHLPGLRRYARALTRDPVAADDLVQDALVRALERRDSFRSDRPLRAWLLAILRNRFIDTRRRVAAEQRRDTRLALELPAFAGAEDAEQAVRLREVAARFDALPEPQRAVLHLVSVEGLSYSEAAEALEVPVGTIMSRLSRARATMRAAEAAPAAAILRIVGGKDAS